MKKLDWKTITLLAAGVAVGILLCLAALFVRCGGWDNFASAMKYASVLHLVSRQYVGDADSSELTDLALDAAVSSLDNWSYYMTAEEYDEYKNYMNNEYRGIGVTVSKDEDTGGFLISALTPDGPAALAGVQVGELIIACDGTDVTDMDIMALKEIIRSAYEKELLLTLQDENGTTRELSVACKTIRTEAVSYELLEDKVGYIRIRNFESGVAQSAMDAAAALEEQGAESLVIDVRQNPGGQVKELCALLDYLLPEGDVFIRADKKGNEWVESSDAAWDDIPLAVLVDGDSYSAAEFFAAALAEYDRAVIVGEATTGKGRSQVTFTMTDGSAVHLSHYRYLTPERVDLSETGGIVPEVELSLDEEQRSALAGERLAYEDDPQLCAAIEALND